jgi:hypothetical protein
MSKNRLDRTIVRGYVGFSYFLCFPATVPPFADPLALSTRFKAQREQGRVGRRGDGGWGMRDGGWGGEEGERKEKGNKMGTRSFVSSRCDLRGGESAAHVACAEVGHGASRS